MTGAAAAPEQPRPFRILVTGSRDWTDLATVCRELAAAAEGVSRDTVVLVSGNAAGADRLSEAYAESQDWGIERHPLTSADWERYGKAAGPRRNAAMVRLGASVCLCFLMPCSRLSLRCPSGPHGSHGASGCADLAEQAGMPVRRFLAAGDSGT